jgi:predicted nucleic acid-binding protein
MTIVYLDTCVWLSALISRDRNHAKALQVLKQAESGHYTVLVSRHVLCETLDVLRQKAATAPQVRSAPTSGVHKTLVTGLYQAFVSGLLQKKNIRIRDTTDPAVAILDAAAKVLGQVWGGVTTEPSCPICRSAYQYMKYDGVDHDDVLHGLIADRIGCDSLITFDGGFNLLSGSPALSHLSIQVL